MINGHVKVNFWVCFYVMGLRLKLRSATDFAGKRRLSFSGARVEKNSWKNIKCEPYTLFPLPHKNSRAGVCQQEVVSNLPFQPPVFTG